jgi:hypothetical protein
MRDLPRGDPRRNPASHTVASYGCLVVSNDALAGHSLHRNRDVTKRRARMPPERPATTRAGRRDKRPRQSVSDTYPIAKSTQTIAVTVATSPHLGSAQARSATASATGTPIKIVTVMNRS